MALSSQASADPPTARRGLRVGDEQYLWILVLLEVGFLAWGRHVFRRFHGG